MLEEADTQSRTNILEYLKNEKPAVYDHVRRQILLFEDIASFPDREMQTIIRELQPDDMARALIGQPPEVTNKFFNNMSEGAGSLLKESMEYMRGAAGAQVEEARGKIVDKIKAMEKEGKISVRQKSGGEGFQVVVEESSRRPPAGKGGAPAGPKPAPSIGAEKAQPDPAEARRCFDAGVQQHEAGKLDDAIRYFRQAIEFDPDLWQAYQYLGAELFEMGRVPEALVYYEKALSYNPDPELQSWLDGYKAQMKG
jgi:tetratricopeptide (TPR) repeat protein